MSNAQKRRKCKKKRFVLFISILFYVDLVCFGPFGTAISELRVRSSDKKIEFKRENDTNWPKNAVLQEKSSSCCCCLFVCLFFFFFFLKLWTKL